MIAVWSGRSRACWVITSWTVRGRETTPPLPSIISDSRSPRCLRDQIQTSAGVGAGTRLHHECVDRELIRSGLSEESWHLLRVAAVLGRRFDLSELASM